MAIEFKSTTNTQAGNTQTQLQVMDVQDFNIKAERQMLQEKLVNSDEIDRIVSTINAYDAGSIVAFGSEAAEDISKVSDQMLSGMSMAQVNDTGDLLKVLGKIMDNFDLDEVKSMDSKSFTGRLLKKMQKKLEQILAKYQTMGDQVDKIYVQLKKYEAEINESNKKLQTLFDANVVHYHKLVKYIMAGEQGSKEIGAHLLAMQQQYEAAPDNMLQIDIAAMEQVQQMLEARIVDLRMSESIAMQSVPMIKTMQFGNLNLIRKINSAFIITLPVFKQALTQAVLLKRQRIQAEAMKALDDRTNEMLIKNAQNTAAQSVLTAKLTAESSIKIETLENTWRTIVNGIDETKQIQENAKKKREEDTIRLQQLKAEYQAKMNAR